jgi:uncharacterized membrane protein
MDKKTGTIITIVGAVVALCLCLSCAGGGAYWAFGSGGDPNWVGLSLLCPALLIWALPILLWVFLVRGKEDEAGAQTGV